MNTLTNLNKEEIVKLKQWYNKLTKRQQDIIINGYSTKFAYHIVRLLLEVEQIMAEGDLDLQRNSEILKSVRRGEWKLTDLESWFDHKEKALEGLYTKSTLPERPKESKIKSLLMECLEMHYDDLSSVIKVAPEVNTMIHDLELLIEKYKV